MKHSGLAAFATLSLLPLFGPGLATAQTQDEIMEYQRCVMRCSASASGADDPAYAACIRDVCDAGAGPVAEDIAPPAPAAAGPGWSFSAHSVIGSSAHIDTGAGGVGYSCGFDTNRVTLMVDNRLFSSDSVVLIVDDFTAAFTVNREPGALSRSQDVGCFVGMREVAAGSTLFLAPGRIEAITAEGGGRYTISQNGGTVEVRPGENLADRLGAIEIPLRGSSQAISQLLRGCPVVRADLDDNCGV